MIIQPISKGCCVAILFDLFVVASVGNRLHCQRQDVALVPMRRFSQEDLQLDRLDLLVLVSPPISTESRLLKEACKSSRVDLESWLKNR